MTMGRGHKLKPSKEKEVKPRTYAILIEPQWHLPAVEVAEHRSSRLEMVVDRRFARMSLVEHADMKLRYKATKTMGRGHKLKESKETEASRTPYICHPHRTTTAPPSRRSRRTPLRATPGGRRPATCEEVGRRDDYRTAIRCDC